MHLVLCEQPRRALVCSGRAGLRESEGELGALAARLEVQHGAVGEQSSSKLAGECLLSCPAVERSQAPTIPSQQPVRVLVR